MVARPNPLTEFHSFPTRFPGPYSLIPAVTRGRCDGLRDANGRILHAGLTAANDRIDPEDCDPPVGEGQRAWLEGRCRKLH